MAPFCEKVGQHVVVHPDPDVIADTPGVGVEEAIGSLVVLDERELREDFAELRAGNPCVQERDMEGIHRILADLLPVARRMDHIGDHAVVRHDHRIEERKLGPQFRWTHVRKNDIAEFDDGIGALANPVLCGLVEGSPGVSRIVPSLAYIQP
jgi:hypothetical protein